MGGRHYKTKRKAAIHPLLTMLFGLAVTVILLNIYFTDILDQNNSSEYSMDRLRLKRRQNAQIDLEDLPDLTTDLLDQVSADNSTKHEIMKLLNEAGIAHLSPRVEALLPTWNSIMDLYYDTTTTTETTTSGPIMEGSCPNKRYEALGIAGMFDSGTNLAANYLEANCDSDGVYWQVGWGKHTPAAFRFNHSVAPSAASQKRPVPTNNILPIVIIRDPYTWMQSMCRRNYGALWHHGPLHCPNLVPIDDIDRKIYKRLPVDKIPVRIKYDFAVVLWNNLAHMWSDWYRQYYDYSEGPSSASNSDGGAIRQDRIIVRYEDWVLYPKQLTRTLCECIGGRMREDDFMYMIESAKIGPAHGEFKTGMVSSFIRMGLDRKHNMTHHDTNLARQDLDKTLMTKFRYKHP